MGTVTFGRLAWAFDPIPIETNRRDRLYEAELERALVERLGRIPGRAVVRQERCCGLTMDVVVSWGSTVTIVELKRWDVGFSALRQLAGYLEHFANHARWDTSAIDWTLYGVLAAPRIRPALAADLPKWCAFQRLDVRRTA